jgi:hypothetical protein
MELGTTDRKNFKTAPEVNTIFFFQCSVDRNVCDDGTT